MLINRLYNEDCLEVLKRLEDNSIDAIVTDPPYGLGFMGKEWDTFDKSQFGKAGSEGINDLKAKKNFNILPRYQSTGLYDFTLNWATECLRIIKPGGHLLSFGGTRTSHRIACAIEDAGWQIRDTIMWVYGSGFPKSLDISKAIDKQAGKKPIILGKRTDGRYAYKFQSGNNQFVNAENNKRVEADSKIGLITEPATPEAKLWEGYGTGLKPAYEPICLAMKPLDGTFAENALKWGVAGLNIDECRIAIPDPTKEAGYRANASKHIMDSVSAFRNKPFIVRDFGYYTSKGRFPANFIHDGSQEVMDLFPNSKSSGKYKQGGNSEWYGGKSNYEHTAFDDSGSAARFFYVAKASRRERDAGLEGMPLGKPQRWNKAGEWTNDTTPARNTHPTVKPLALMEYLVKLVTRPGHIVLDPFLGSGTTALACIKLGRYYIGCEIDKDYYAICQKRIEAIVC